MNHQRRHSATIVGILLVGVLFLLQGCSTKKNTAASRRYQEFITRYNIHYNGDTHYKETLKDMETKYEDDFTRLLFVHPAEARGADKVPQPQGDFTRSIEKAQKAIQLRSIKKKPARKPGHASDPAYKAWMKRDEYNPFLHNSWMMMARSQFMNGDFPGAAATFFYISRHFTWLPATVTEARLWQARSYCAMDWLFEAEMILTRIKQDELTSRSLRLLYNETYADFLVRSRDYAAAVPYLSEAARLSSGANKVRLNFLTGQVAALAGDRERAYVAFRKAGNASSATYRTSFNARIKQSEVYTGADVEPEVKSLKRMLRYDRNKEYADQIYYAIGNLYLSRGDTLKAIDNYRLAAEKSTRNGIDKAISQATLAGLYYDRGEYDLAQPCYAEAVPQLPDTYPDYVTLKKRSDMLDELATYSQNVTLQDSLLKLSNMTPDEQLKVVEKIIKELEKQEREDAETARREEFMNNRQGDGNVNNANTPTTFTLNGDDSWYFYNPSTVQAGKTEFQRRWGNRKLEDDWRRRNKAAFSFDEFGDNGNDETDENENAEGEDAAADDTTAGDANDKEKLARESDPHYPEYYLKQIPNDSTTRQLSHDVIQEGLYNMGLILKDKLEDYPAADIQWQRLLRDYPDNVYRLDTYFNIYLMASRNGDSAMAEHYRRLILDDFPDSKEALALRDPNYIENLRLMDERQELMYQAAFDAYMEDRNDDVHAAYDEMNRDYSMSKLMPRFMFLHALAYVTEQQPDKFKETLTEMLERYPSTDLSPYASAWLKGLAQGRQLQADNGGNMRGLLWDIHLSNDSTAEGDGSQLEFDLNPEDTQLLVLLYPTNVIAPNQLLYDIARHNFNTFVVKDFELEQMNFGQLGLLIVRGFDNLAELKHYRSLMQQNPDLSVPRGVIPVVISEKNFETMLKHGASFEQYFEFARDKTYRDTEESVLDPEVFGPSDGLPPMEDGEPMPTDVGDDSTEAPTELTVTDEIEAEPIVKEADEPVKVEPVKATPKIPEPVKADKKQPAAIKKEPDRKPVPKKPVPQPDYPAGSEGDDPLLD